jgi:hypothetical protein
VKEWLQKQAKQQAAAAGKKKPAAAGKKEPAAAGKKKPTAGKAAAASQPTGGHDKMGAATRGKGLKRKAADLKHGAGTFTRQGQQWTPEDRETILLFVQNTHIAGSRFSKVFFQPLEQTLQREKGARRREQP